MAVSRPTSAVRRADGVALDGAGHTFRGPGTDGYQLAIARYGPDGALGPARRPPLAAGLRSWRRSSRPADGLSQLGSRRAAGFLTPCWPSIDRASAPSRRRQQPSTPGPPTAASRPTTIPYSSSAPIPMGRRSNVAWTPQRLRRASRRFASALSTRASTPSSCAPSIRGAWSIRRLRCGASASTYRRRRSRLRHRR